MNLLKRLETLERLEERQNKIEESKQGKNNHQKLHERMKMAHLETKNNTPIPLQFVATSYEFENSSEYRWNRREDREVIDLIREFGSDR